MFFPAEALIIHDSSNPDTAKACEAARNEYVNLVGPGTPYASTVRYSFIHKNRKRWQYYRSLLTYAVYFQGEYSQMLLPNDIEHMFKVRVFGIDDPSVVSPERPAYPVCIYRCG